MRLTLEIPTTDLDAYSIVLVDYPCIPLIGAQLFVNGYAYTVKAIRIYFDTFRPQGSECCGTYVTLIREPPCAH